jgi:TetR/AcrR family transcriptional regulator, transcriptional repressor for nem operon
VGSHVDEVRGVLESLEVHRTPKARLKAFVRMLISQAGLMATHGCPQGSLCSELDKRDDGTNRQRSELLGAPIDWAERQFREMGRRDARDLAVALIASYQGIAVISNSFGDPELVVREGKRLERWIDSLS